MDAMNPKQAAGDTKTPLVLLEPEAKRQIADVMASGAAKYGARNYMRTPIRASAYISAMQRHLDAFQCGEDIDPESGLRHLAHIGANINILLAVGDALIDDREEPAIAPGQRTTDALTVFKLCGGCATPLNCSVVRRCFGQDAQVTHSGPYTASDGEVLGVCPEDGKPCADSAYCQDHCDTGCKYA